jgi:hypothetical protein
VTIPKTSAQGAGDVYLVFRHTNSCAQTNVIIAQGLPMKFSVLPTALGIWSNYVSLYTKEGNVGGKFLTMCA